MENKIMVVDDNREFLEELDETLSLSGYETITYRDGESALRNMEKDKPDLVLLDLKMSGKSGFEVAGEINKNRNTKTIPIIAMTGFYTKDEHQILMKICGMEQCLIKPFNPLDVITKIARLLKKGATKMKIKEIMTKNVDYITTETTLKEAAKEMEARNIGALPVYESDKLTGILTDRDIVVRSTAKGDKPDLVNIKSIMTAQIDSCGEEDNLEEVSERMKAKKIRRMPVTDSEGKLTGMVSMADIVLKGSKETACEILEMVSEPG